MEHLSPVHDRLSAVIVTTPQAVALNDAMKSLSFTREVKLRVLGIVENMSGYVCPCCGEISNVFSTGGGEEMARREGVPFLGALPVDTELVSLLDAAEIAPKEGSQLPEKRGFGLARRYQETPSGKLFKKVLDTLLDTLLATERRISPN
jgi:MinD superfamily P-loop ATPase